MIVVTASETERTRSCLRGHHGRDETMDLHDLLGAVKDEASFVAFVTALGADFSASADLESEMPSGSCGPAALGWENTRIDDFLESAAAWATDSTDEMRACSDNSWHRCAAILLMGKLYE